VGRPPRRLSSNGPPSNRTAPLAPGGRRLGSDGVRFPADSGVINLAATPHNVKCDGVADNTTAIQNALNTYANTGDVATRFSFRTLALPAGTCLVSNTLHSPGNAIRLVGAGQDTTVLKLKDNASGYGSAGSPSTSTGPASSSPPPATTTRPTPTTSRT
jgi:hypothetical protein